MKLHILIILWQSESLEYKRLEVGVLFLSISLILLDPKKLDNKLNNKLVARHISQVLAFPPFVYFLQGLLPKSDSEFRKIHYFSFSLDSYVNNQIPQKAVHLDYSTMNNLLQNMMAVELHFVIL